MFRDVDYSSSKPPGWFDRHKEKGPCDCEADPKRVASATRYSDFGYFLRECPECGHKWAFWIEG